MTGDRIDELAAAWSVDDPDPALRAELEDRLRRDPAARRRFLDHCVAEMALVDSLASAANATAAKNAQGPLRPHTHRRARRSPAFSLLAGWAAGLAALLLIGVLLLPGSHTMHVTSGSLLVDGRTILPGERVVLPLTSAMAGADGVELDDQAGTVLRAEAESDFAINAPGGINLESGHLTLDIDGQRAPPTAVHTLELVVRVVGTHFSVVRGTARTEVDVHHGQVHVTTPDQTMRELAAGMRLAADHSGFISAKPTNDDPQREQPLRLIVIAEDKSERILEPLAQVIRLPANRPFTLRAEVAPDVVALGFRLATSQDLPMRERRIELTKPFDLWGDTKRQPIFSTLPTGTHYLTISYFADLIGKRVLGTRQFTVIAE